MGVSDSASLKADILKGKSSPGLLLVGHFLLKMGSGGNWLRCTCCVGLAGCTAGNNVTNVCASRGKGRKRGSTMTFLGGVPPYLREVGVTLGAPGLC